MFRRLIALVLLVVLAVRVTNFLDYRPALKAELLRPQNLTVLLVVVLLAVLYRWGSSSPSTRKARLGIILAIAGGMVAMYLWMSQQVGMAVLWLVVALIVAAILAALVLGYAPRRATTLRERFVRAAAASMSTKNPPPADANGSAASASAPVSTP